MNVRVPKKLKYVTYTRIVVLPDEIDEKTKSGLYIPRPEEQTNYRYGTVVAVGTDRVGQGGVIEKIQCAVGDRVYYNKLAVAIPYIEKDENDKEVKYMIMTDIEAVAVIIPDEDIVLV